MKQENDYYCKAIDSLGRRLFIVSSDLRILAANRYAARKTKPGITGKICYEYFHDQENRASIRASETTPVEVVALDYDELHALLSESESTREALHEAAHKHEEENIQRRGDVK